jgi:Polyketide cyclase / dehydrase and lipid transport
MLIEHRIRIATAPGSIYSIYADVTHWPHWDPDTRAATLNGPFAVGSRGTLTPAKGNTVPMVVTFADRARGFTVESRIPLLLRMVFEHELKALGPSETEVIHRVTLSGLLSWLIGPALKRQLDAGLPVTLARLKRMAETGSPEGAPSEACCATQNLS